MMSRLESGSGLELGLGLGEGKVGFRVVDGFIQG